MVAPMSSNVTNQRCALVAVKISKEKMAEIQAKIEADRRKLAESKGMAEEERDRVKGDLLAKENELKKAQEEQTQLSTKLQVWDRCATGV